MPKQLKMLSQIVGGLLIAFVVIGFVVDTGSTVPPENALVYLNPDGTTYYPPTRTPGNSDYIPVAYKEAKAVGAKPDDSTGFNVDGPPLLIYLLEELGVISEFPRYWLPTNTRVEYVE